MKRNANRNGETGPPTRMPLRPRAVVPAAWLTAGLALAGCGGPAISGGGSWGAVGSSMRCDDPGGGARVCAVVEPSAADAVVFRILLENRGTEALAVDLAGTSLDVDGDGWLPVGPPEPVQLLGGTSSLATLSFAAEPAALKEAAFVTLRVPTGGDAVAGIEFSSADLVVVGVP